MDRLPPFRWVSLGARAITRAVCLTCLAPILISSPLQAQVGAGCMYIADSGELVAVNNLNTVPRSLRSRVVCRDKSLSEVAAPDQLEVGRDVRTADFTTELGPMRVRWSRSVEACFGKPPSRAVSEAAQAVNKALKSGRFASEAKFARREWTLGFIDKASAFAQFPVALTLGGHAGFMMPPNRIYIITDFVSRGCSDKANADALLTQVLLHEMGHVIEFLLLGEPQQPGDRKRAEGFASWFEQYSADFTSTIPAGKVKNEYATLAGTYSAQAGARGFSGSAHDYALAALQFQTIVDRKGISGLMRVYQHLREGEGDFYVAVERGVGWNKATLERQMIELQRRSG